MVVRRRAGDGGAAVPDAGVQEHAAERAGRGHHRGRHRPVQLQRVVVPLEGAPHVVHVVPSWGMWVSVWEGLHLQKLVTQG